MTAEKEVPSVSARDSLSLYLIEVVSYIAALFCLPQALVQAVAESGNGEAEKVASEVARTFDKILA